MKKRLLILFFLSILIVMTAVTVRAISVRNILDNGHLMRDPWFLATLADAYCGFITFYVWVYLKEKTLIRRAAWFVAIMLLGNFAMATYAIIQISKLKPKQPIASILT